MVTGSNNITLSLLKFDASLNSETIESAHTIISLSPTGFSTLVLDATKSKTLLLAQSHWDNSLNLNLSISNFKACVEKLSIPIKKAASVKAIINFSKFSIVPEAFYTKGSGQDILSYTAKLEEGEHIFADHLESSEAVAIYTIPKALLNWINQFADKAKCQHQISALLKLHDLYNQAEIFAHLHVGFGEADFLLSRKGKVLFYNKFYFESEDDLVYHILFALEQNRVLATELNLFLSGNSMKGEKLFVLLSKYIGEIDELPLPSLFELSSSHTPREIRQNINLLGGI